jgi:hypothetical protein
MHSCLHHPHKRQWQIRSRGDSIEGSAQQIHKPGIHPSTRLIAITATKLDRYIGYLTIVPRLYLP